jgi:hypothetical protein
MRIRGVPTISAHWDRWPSEVSKPSSQQALRAVLPKRTRNRKTALING